MAHITCKITWMTALLKDTGLQNLPPDVLKCDNIVDISIELAFHFIRDKVKSGEIVSQYVPSHSQVVDMLTKPISVKQHHYLLSNLGATDPPPTQALSG